MKLCEKPLPNPAKKCYDEYNCPAVWKLPYSYRYTFPYTRRSGMNGRKKVKFNGKLKSYMQWPLIMTVFLILMDFLVYCIDIKAGLVVSAFTVVYLIIALVLLLHYKPNIMNEMIYFATQYGQVQKKLLEEFDIP